MPIPGWPSSVEFTDYKNVESIDGSSNSTFTLVCAFADMIAVRALFMGAVDASDPNLHCVNFDFGYLNNDAATGMYQCTAHFIPTWKLNKLLPNLPFYIYMNFSSQDLTLPSTNWKWASGAAVPPQVNPVKILAIQQITLKGSRSGVDLSTYASYSDKVNSDTFLGKAPGYVMFRTAAISPRQIDTGVITNDVEIRLESRNVPWNYFFNPDPAVMDFAQINDPSGNPIFASTAFAGLLT